MHVAIIGAGALGRIYGVHLAQVGTRVTFVVRDPPPSPSTFSVENAVSGAALRIEAPRLRARVPADADVALVTVRFDQLLDEAGGSPLAALLSEAPHCVPMVLTPMFPRQYSALRLALGRAVVVGMPGVSGYASDAGAVRYWTPQLVNTLFDLEGSRETASGATQLAELLAKQLCKAGLATRLERDVLFLNAATTTSFFPLIAAVDAAGGVDAALEDAALMELTLAACKECQALAVAVGRIHPFATVLLRFVGPFTLKAGVRLARRLHAESVQFVEQHFGRKLHAQHLLMAQEILRLGEQHACPTQATGDLAARLERGDIHASTP